MEEFTLTPLVCILNSLVMGCCYKTVINLKAKFLSDVDTEAKLYEGLLCFPLEILHMKKYENDCMTGLHMRQQKIDGANIHSRISASQDSNCQRYT